MVSPTEAIDILRPILENDYQLDQLVKQLQSRVGVIPFVGAGISIPVGFPGWTTFLSSRGATAGVGTEVEEEIQKGLYEDAADILLNAMGVTAFEDAIRASFGDHVLKGRSIDGAAAVLLRLAAGPVITTNFDHVLEVAFKQAGREFEKVVSGARVDSANEALYRDRRFLLKLHGDVDERTERILTGAEYERHYGDLDSVAVESWLPLPSLLRRVLEGRPLLFVGCSLAQDRTVKVLRQVAKGLPIMGHYAIVEIPATKAERLKKARHLSNHSIRPIWYPSGRHDLIEPLLTWLADQIPAVPPPPDPPQPCGQCLSRPDDPLLVHSHGFIGQEKKVEEILRFLADGGATTASGTIREICNVWGAPGAGKTAVCKEVLQRYLAAHPSSRGYYVDLSEGRDESGFLARLGLVLGVPGATDRSQLLESLSTIPGILYLDNLEDILGDQAARELLIRLPRIPGVRVLASSRENLDGVAHNVPVGRLDEDSATKLFLQEWEHSGASHSLKDNQDLRDFLRIDLGFHPLSLVLVAAQAYRYNSLAELRDAWHRESVKLAALHKGTGPHSSLEGSLSHSFAAVLREEPSAVRLWGIVAIFPDGIRPAAWKGLSSTSSGSLESALYVLQRLSLAERAPDGTIRMLAPLRRFILDKAERREDGLVEDDLLTAAFPYFASLAKEARQYRGTEAYGKKLDDLLREFPNLSHFARLAVLQGRTWVEKLSEISRDMLDFYQFRTLIGREVLSTLLAAQRREGMSREVALSSECLGRIELHLGHIKEAAKLYRKARVLFEKLGNDLGLANTLRSLGDLAHLLGHIEEAAKLYRKARALFEKVGDDLGLANTLKALGDLESDLGNIEKAAKLYRKARALFEKVGDDLGLANTLKALGDLERDLGHFEEAAKLYREARVHFERLRDDLGLGEALMGLADVARENGNIDEARSLCREARRLFKEVQDPIGTAYACVELGRLLLAREEAAAKELLAEARRAAAASYTPSVVEYVEMVIAGKRPPYREYS